MLAATKNIIRNDFLAFARIALRKLDGTVLDDDRYVELLATYVTRFADGSINRLIVNLPPRHGKTRIFSTAGCAWILAQDPCAKIMVITYSTDLAETISRDIRSIMQSKWFKDVFSTRIAKGHSKANDFATTAGGGVYATGFDGSITGFGGNYIIIDDPHDIDDAGNPEQLSKTVDRYYTKVARRLNNRNIGRILAVGHRLHENDLFGELLQDGDWTHLALPIIAIRDRTYSTAYGPWKRRKGELLRPTADNLKELERDRKRLVNPSFEMHYQQDCEGLALPALTAAHFRTFNEDAVVNLPRFISVDPGTDEGGDRSFSVVQLWATDGVMHYLLDQERKRCKFSDLVEIVRRFVRNNIGAPILIEKTANGPALLSALSKKQQARAIAVVVRDSKSARLRRHYEKFISGLIRIHPDARFRDKYIEEFVAFPRARHNDQVDATTQYLDYVQALEGFDFSRSNIRQFGTMVVANNSDFRQQVPFAPTQIQNVFGVGSGAFNSSCRPVAQSQPYDPKAPGLVAVSRPRRIFGW